METTKQRLLREAAALMGRPELAQRLKVSERELADWIGGSAKMPDSKLLLLANILDGWAGRQLVKSKRDRKSAV